MALRDEIIPFIDGNQLVSPSLVPAGTLKASDNGTMYSAEYYVMLQKSGQLISSDYTDFDKIIQNCINSEGLLNRIPVDRSDGQEGPDDYYGVLNGCKTLGNTIIPRQFLLALIRYCGCLNNINPGTWTTDSFLARQSQLVACMIAASFPSWKNPLHILIRTLCFPWFFYASICILIAGWGVDTNDADTRRLSWHYWQVTKSVSLLCWLAGKIWLKRLYNQYPNGMRDVARIYYQEGHPFIKYWITE